jgi:predicted flap endonuclease-1-like 5' DNA nuclease
MNAMLDTQTLLIAGGAAIIMAAISWLLRGVVMGGKLAKAVGERRIAQADLDQAREEIDRLYAAQKKQSLMSAAPGDPAVQAELNARDGRITELTSEVNRLKSELGTMRRVPVKSEPVPSPAPLATPVSSAGKAPPDTPEMLWRNRHLESRLKLLETELAEAKERAQQAPQILAAPVPPVAELAPAEVLAASPQQEIADWRQSYLATRVVALEDELASAAAIAAPAPALDHEAAENEEIASLRWKLRALEGRLAYFEGGKSDAPVETSATVAPPVFAAPAAPPMPERSLSEALLDRLEKVDAEADAHESADGMQQPLALTKPVEGRSDDLTRIGGVDPQIQDMLNKIGIFHFDQIAAWTDSHAAWVGQHIGAPGRVQREGWVKQAAVLVKN